MPLSRLVAFVREADWLNAERVRVYGWILLGLNLATFGMWMALSRDLITPAHQPIGADFMSFYAASKLALSGQAANAWHPDAHHLAQNSVFHQDFGYWAFFYPPAYLLICAPLALLPYIVALGVWLTTTTAAAVRLTQAWLAQMAPNVRIGLVPLLAFPALWINIGNGQNAALTTAIFIAGFLYLDRRPFVSGLILGLLVIKPQLAIALPFLLAASGRWKTFVGAAISAITLCALAYPLVGEAGYQAFFANAALATDTLNRSLVEPGAMQSLFAALRVLHAPLPLAYGLHFAVAAAALILACYTVVRHRPDMYAFSALIIATTGLLSPFLLDYDLCITAIPLIWLIMTGLRQGFAPWEKGLGLAVFLFPLVSRNLAMAAHVPLGPVVLLGLYMAVIRRIAHASVAVASAPDFACAKLEA